ncbi:NUDIX hydrolase [Labilibaculum euxinus]|uniref:NUDIX domain-containing protein n=1 Tax=Labilibaculum euxinus TaxID=2686357 RepID=A0A7M4D3H5_9BACT|nr:NUDIX domain-containing protein [Labilibaculum euxinus]MUP37204.1 NUDIX domain-containing protein [Labilibaculum euxinus]MVB06409.1 NUDIX domain-containing protein [Labilibaculum euxinus]
MPGRPLNNYISVDCVIFGYNGQELQVLLVDRTLTNNSTGQPEFTDLTLTGNHIYEDETIEQAAYRVLFDLTGLKNVFLDQFKTFAHPDRLKKENDRRWLIHDGRDPDKRIVSIGYFALLATQNITLEWKGRNVKWVPVSEVGELAFDHNQILEEALIALRNKIKQEPIGFELLPEKFSLTQLQNIYEVILSTELDKRNFRKKIARMKYLIPTDEKQTGVAHKPARLYVFSREVYEKTKKELFDFTV